MVAQFVNQQNATGAIQSLALSAAGHFAPQPLGYIAASTGRHSQGLPLVAVVECLAVLLVLAFVSADKRASR